jgi:DNA-binding NtrC family response regulator
MASTDDQLTHPTRAAHSLRARFDWQKVRAYRLHLRGPDGTETQQEYALRVLRAGTRPENDLVLDDTRVSRIHFEILADDHGFRLRDLGSKNGTVVDGYMARDLYLKQGSRIVVGHTEIAFEPLGVEAERPLARGERFGPLVGRSAAMRELFALLERVASSDVTLLIEGETGTGKELIARAVHEASARSGGPFVVFDAAAVPRELLESILFGHERGAFTGAAVKRTGLMEEADGGTLLLDELGELPLALQPKLLRALETREILPVGANEPRRVDVRMIAATNRDLAAEINGGAFRDDLYYRLAVVRLVVPPLRERPEDVRALVAHLASATLGQAMAALLLERITEDNWQELEGYPWPGNVRELRNMVGRTLALAGPELPRRLDPGADAQPPSSLRAPAQAQRPHLPGARPPRPPQRRSADLERPFLEQKKTLVEDFEKSYLLGMLERHGGNISRAAAASGLDRMYFKRLLKKYRD